MKSILHTRPARVNSTLPAWFKRFLDLASIPCPIDSWEQWQRGCHRDLDWRLDDVRPELLAIRCRLAFDDRPDPWLIERRDAIEGRLGDAS